MYGDSDSEITFSFSGVLDGESLIGSLAREEGEDVGSYDITNGTLTNENNPNYNIILSYANYKITQRLAFISIEDSTKVYGEADPDFSFSQQNTNILADDLALFVSALTRVEGEDVGTYTITLNESDSKLSNYLIILIEGKLTITKKDISIKIYDVEVAYGETPNFEYCIEGLAFDDQITLDLITATVTGVGDYEIILNSFDYNNYNLVSVETAYLKVFKGNLSADEFYLEDITTTYTGEAFSGISLSVEFDFVFIFTQNGEVTEPINAGTYEVYAYFAGNENYNEFTTNTATLVIEKASLNASDFVLSDKTTTYTGENIYIDALSSEFEFVYKYLLPTGEYSDHAVDAGTYEVYAYFAGNENYNEFTTNTATLVIEQKLLSITLKTLTFVYDGNAKRPEYEINLSENVSVDIVFEVGYYPSEVGEYNFEIVSRDANYYTNLKGTLYIVSSLNSENSYGSVINANAMSSNLSVEVVKDNNSSLKNTFTSNSDGRSCISVYKFINVDDYDTDEVFTVKIKAQSNAKNVKIYLASENGQISEVSYTFDGENYVFYVSDLSASILVTASDNSALYIKLLASVAILVALLVATRSIKNKKISGFYNRNTTIRKISQKDFLENEEIVESKLFDDDRIDILN